MIADVHTRVRAFRRTGRHAWTRKRTLSADLDTSAFTAERIQVFTQIFTWKKDAGSCVHTYTMLTL